jgi:hypothetical protein
MGRLGGGVRKLEGGGDKKGWEGEEERLEAGVTKVGKGSKKGWEGE